MTLLSEKKHENHLYVLCFVNVCLYYKIFNVNVFLLFTIVILQAGGCYLFSNLRGCDGQRVYFNGCSCIALNGGIIKRTQQFSLKEVVSL